MRKKHIIMAVVFFLIFLIENLQVAGIFNVTAYPLQRAETFHPDIRTDYRSRISDGKPDVIILGDSAISQLDENIISSITGRRTLVFPSPGTGSAYWFLFIRNQLYLADHRPDYFFLFFRDTTLTVPNYRVNGEYFIRLEEIASSWDEDVYALAINCNKSSIVRFLERYIPVYAYRVEIYADFINWTRDAAPIFFLGVEKDEIETAFEGVFERSRINDQIWETLLLNIDQHLYLDDNLNFSASVTKSFLPAMVRDLKMMGVKPGFVRVRYRSHALDEPDSEELTEYLDTLESYLENSGAEYIDFAAVESLSVSMYEDNFHISSENSDAASTIIAELLAKVMD